jgi:hypothetical protein
MEVYYEFVGVSFLFLVVAITVVIYLYFRYRTRVAAQETIRIAVERSQQLQPELLDRLIQSHVPARSRAADLRRGIIAIALGVGIAMIGVILGGHRMQAALSIGALPLFIGIAYLVLWRFMPRE